jgi:O-antigen/teichoic acid export membrane protein
MSTVPQTIEQSPAPPPGRSLAHSLFSGTSSIGVAVSLERGLGFVAHLLAARIGGTRVFGTYSLALTTANSVATYAGAGIGTTANRFSGMYPFGTPEYSQLQRTLAWVSAQSALVAAAILWFTAGPIATRLIGNPALTPLLQLAALSSGALILLECTRGFLIGQRRFTALLALSLMAGGGMLLVIPAATYAGPKAMIIGQASVSMGAVVMCALFARSLGILDNSSESAASLGQPKVRALSVWLFGLGQLVGVIGLNAAGWWTASLVGRADHTMLQMSFYIAAGQIRNVIAMAPGLVQQSAWAMLSDEAGGGYGGPGRVLMASTLLASVLALLLTGVAIAVLPWVLGLMYGSAFRGAEPAAALAIATSLVHMAAAPASSRLTIVSLRSMGIINAIWAGMVIVLGPLLIPRGGAVPATAIMLAAHLAGAILVLLFLWQRNELPRGLTSLSMPMMIGSFVFGALGLVRWYYPATRIEISLGILALMAVFIGWTLLAASASGCVPPPSRWRAIATAVAPPFLAKRLRGGAEC